MTITVSKLNQFFDQELNSELKEVLITRDEQGRYTLFGEYSIVPTTDKGVNVRSNQVNLDFTNIKNALAYVTLLHAGHRKEARRIEQLDLSLSSVNLDLEVHRNILRNRTDAHSKLLFIIKIQEDSIKRRRIVEEIKSYINSSIRIQERSFARRRKPILYKSDKYFIKGRVNPYETY
jgi:hypothetical protein